MFDVLRCSNRKGNVIEAELENEIGKRSIPFFPSEDGSTRNHKPE